MERRPGNTFSILRGYLVPALSVVIVIGALELVFTAYEKNQQDAIWKSVSALLRNEADLGSSYQLSRNLRDMEVANLINCVVLKETTPSERLFYDSTHRSGCESSMNKQKGFLTSISNASWYLEFQSRDDIWFLVSRWLLRFVVVGLLSGIFLYFHRKSKKEERRVKRAEFERQWLVDLANQTRHDVASPISALRIISKNEEIPENIRNFLGMAVERTEKIFSDLQKAKGVEAVKENMAFNLVDVVDQLVEEKKQAHKVSISYIKNAESIKTLGSAADLGRVLSNLINNSAESFTDFEYPLAEIKISVGLDKGLGRIVISDNGKGIDSEDLKKIGQKGFSKGKMNGSGLGVYHAKSTIESWGGSFRISSIKGIGTETEILLPISR